jgi:hypothetical protein
LLLTLGIATISTIGVNLGKLARKLTTNSYMLPFHEKSCVLTRSKEKLHKIFKRQKINKK